MFVYTFLYLCCFIKIHYIKRLNKISLKIFSLGLPYKITLFNYFLTTSFTSLTAKESTKVSATGALVVSTTNESTGVTGVTEVSSVCEVQLANNTVANKDAKIIDFFIFYFIGLFFKLLL